jgi:hypothetical protein
MKKLYIFKEDLRMANETLKAGFERYMAEADAKCAKFPGTRKPGTQTPVHSVGPGRL